VLVVGVLVLVLLDCLVVVWEVVLAVWLALLALLFFEIKINPTATTAVTIKASTTFGTILFCDSSII
jgi:hypothetical protein